jgi:Tfp pilus assembly protein PilF
MRLLFCFLFAIAIFDEAFAQVEQESGFKLVKAEYLFGTERFEDAIKELNDVLKVDPLMKKALLLRAETKYKLAAYKGSKDDAIKYIEMNGITMEAATLLGKSEFQLDNVDAALNSLSAAIALETKDVKVYEMRAEIYTKKKMAQKACQDWATAAKMGSTTGAINAKKCGAKEQKTEPQKPMPTEDNNTIEDKPTTSENQSNTSNENSSPTKDASESTNTNAENGTVGRDSINNNASQVEAPDNINIPEEDDTENKFIIDEDLSITIYGQGLGKRKILEKPSILILSEEDGIVAVEFCVNENGKVDFAEFNSQKSTISKKSLVSLAIRKSKEFWFEKSDYPKQCGYMLFEVKGS